MPDEPPASPRLELTPAAPPLEPLRKIELEILSLLNRGLTNQEIANKLAMTVGTINWRMNQIFGKLYVRNRIEELARAYQLKLLQGSYAALVPSRKPVVLDIVDIVALKARWNRRS